MKKKEFALKAPTYEELMAELTAKGFGYGDTLEDGTFVERPPKLFEQAQKRQFRTSCCYLGNLPRTVTVDTGEVDEDGDPILESTTTTKEGFHANVVMDESTVFNIEVVENIKNKFASYNI